MPDGSDSDTGRGRDLAATPAAPSFPIVGVGASAGGLEAASRLLANLPEHPGLALVLVQHLDPSHESGLVSLLSRVSSLPVCEASDEMRVEVDRVYVIPPGKAMVLRNGALHTTPRETAPEPQRLIDLFLGSLADERGGRRAGVILSGTGSDGTRGLQLIQAAGGLTLAQDASAGHGGMPLSAIEAGCADFVLAPEDIARELVRIGAQGVLPAEAPSDEPEDAGEREALARIFRSLRSSGGVDFSLYKQGTVRRRIGRRMAVRHAASLADYAAITESDPDELVALFEETLIHVTSFFRDPEVFSALDELVFPALLEGRPAGQPIRIWVPGCSTGEEAYSLAIALLEFLERHDAQGRSIKVFATDVSDAVIAKARAGWFGQHLKAEVSPERLRRFFDPEGDGYRIHADVRELCVFARQDATRDPPFSKLDLISCRNVLIYLGAHLKARLLPTFHYALEEDGFLLLGTAESVGSASDLFSAVDARRGIHVRKAVPSRLRFDGPSARAAPAFRAHGSGTPAPRPVGTRDVLREADRLVLSQAPAGVVIDEALDILQFRGDTAPYLSQAAGAPTRNLLGMAREGLLPDLRSAIEEAQRLDAPARRQGVSVRGQDDWRAVDLEVLPFRLPGSKDRSLLVQFRAAEAPEASATGPRSPDEARVPSDRVARLERELAGTKDYLQGIIAEQQDGREALEAAHEEMLSSNEELQSTNEELQTAKEELQATNEELLTVNEELEQRSREASRLGDDLGNLLTSVKIPIVMLERDLRVRRFTPAAARLLHLTAGDVGRPLTDVAPRLRIDDLGGLVLEVLRTLAPCEREVQDLDGRWHLLSIRPYRTQRDEIDGAVISLGDIDATKRSEERIAAARDYAENIVASVRDPLVVLDADLRVQTANQSFLEAFGTTQEDVAGRRLPSLDGGRWDLPGLREELGRVVAGGAAFENFEAVLDRAGSGPRTLLLNARSIANTAGDDALVLLAIEDVTERRLEQERRLALERKMQDAQKLESLGLLAGGLAHDFNNILTSILGHADLAALDARPGSDLRRHLDRIEESVRRASDLCGQMLAYSGRGRFVIKPIDLNALVGDASRLVELAVGKRAVVRLELARTAPVVRGDATQLRQVLMNLLLNAAEAMGESGGAITLSTGLMAVDRSYLAGTVLSPALPEGDYAYLEVADDGEGMDAETLGQIFDPFFTTKFAGRGLGLAAVLGIVRGHGGALKIESKPGEGSVFRLLLPRSEVPVELEPAAAPAPAAAEAGRGAILVVDDEALVLEVVARLVESLGFEVVRAQGGAAALEAFEDRHGEFRLVLLDLTMPGVGGEEAFVRMRERRPDAAVVLMSGHGEQDALERFSAKGLSGFLRKPFGLKDLSALLEAVLGDH
jgi:two-component system CheB/CheR fusion protein